MDDFRAVHRYTNKKTGRSVYDVFKYAVVDGKEVGERVISNCTLAEALRIAQALIEWQPERSSATGENPGAGTPARGKEGLSRLLEESRGETDLLR